MAYEAAMRREAERLAAAQKRNIAAAMSSSAADEDEGFDAKEAAWASVFASGQSAAAESEEEARRRKYQRKAERRKEKVAAQDANAASLTLYVSGLPHEVSWTAVQSLFGRAGEVRRVKLYKDANGEQKGDGLVTFATEAGVREAESREWNCFGEALTVQRAHFEAKPEGLARAEWTRVVELLHMFSVEEVAAAADRKAFLASIDDDVWRECARFGPVERVQTFPADPHNAVSIRFGTADAAAACQGYVKLRGLQGKAERNGQVGVINSHATESGRYTVQLRDGTLLALRRQNLLQMVSVRLTGLDGEQSRHNAERGTIFEYDETAGMYGVELDGSGDAIPVPIACAVVPDGTVGTVVGLQSAAQYNGTLAEVLSHDDEAGRYVARLDGGQMLRLRRQNLIVAS